MIYFMEYVKINIDNKNFYDIIEYYRSPLMEEAELDPEIAALLAGSSSSSSSWTS